MTLTVEPSTTCTVNRVSSVIIKDGKVETPHPRLRIPDEIELVARKAFLAFSEWT